MQRSFLIAGIIILLFSCTNPKRLMDNSKINRIYFGKRGGFTNIPMEYVLFERGQLYKLENDSLSKFRRVTPDKIEKIDSLLNVTNFKDQEINDPGNITYFIRVVKQDYENEVKWCESSGQPGLVLIYQALLETIKTKK